MRFDQAREEGISQGIIDVRHRRGRQWSKSWPREASNHRSPFALCKSLSSEHRRSATPTLRPRLTSLSEIRAVGAMRESW
jgi:hypothetical protein